MLLQIHTMLIRLLKVKFVNFNFIRIQNYLFVLVLSVSSAEVRMRVFEFLTALCVYSQDGYEFVLKALQDFQVNIHSFCIVKKENHISERSSL